MKVIIMKRSLISNATRVILCKLFLSFIKFKKSPYFDHVKCSAITGDPLA